MFVGGVLCVQLLNNSDKNLTLDGFIIAVCAAGAWSWYYLQVSTQLCGQQR